MSSNDSNGFRGKDFYKRKESKSSCPILRCDGCDDGNDDDDDEKTAMKDEKSSLFKNFGSVAARAQAWEK